MKLTIELVPLTHHDLSSHRVFEALHAVAWKVHYLDTAREADGLTLKLRDQDLIRVKVTG